MPKPRKHAPKKRTNRAGKLETPLSLEQWEFRLLEYEHRYAQLCGDGRFRQAAAAITKAIELAPWDPLLRILFATACFNAGEHQAGVDSIETAADLVEFGTDITHEVGWAELAKIGVHLREEDPQRALALVRRAIEICPENEPELRDLACRMLEMNLEQEALPVLKRAMDQDPRDPRLWALLVHTYAEVERFSDALSIGEQGLKKWPEHHGLRLSLAAAYLDSERPHDALPHLHDLLREDSEESMSHALAGVAYAATGDDKQAKKEQALARRLGAHDHEVEDRIEQIDQIIKARRSR